MSRGEGSFLAGLILGLFMNLMGLIIGIAIDKPKTRNGAIVGFILSIVPHILLIIYVVKSMQSGAFQAVLHLISGGNL